MRLFGCLCISLLFCISCYRMPAEGEVSVIPDTNNPNMIKGNQPLMPAMPNVDF